LVIWIRRFWSLERKYPRSRRLIWRAFYNIVAWLIPRTDLGFMNWGYVPLDGELEIEIGDVVETDRVFVQLYAYTLSPLEVGGRDVLEVGSGRGGGAAWVARCLEPRSMTGVDLAGRAVALASRIYDGIPRLRFLRGTASRLPLADCSVDVVVNVESCHHYPSMPDFLAEVHRVLRPGGMLALSDYRESHEMDVLEAALADSPFERVRAKPITANVLAAMDTTHEFKEEILREHVWRGLHTIMRTFMATRGSEVYRAFDNGDWVYWLYHLRKR
jgi:SAM-dependent methyltransferase